MKKSTVYLLSGIVILILSFCAIKIFQTKPQVSYYGPAYKDKEKFVYIDLNEFEDYDSLYNRVDSIACHDSIPVIELINGLEFKYLALINRCYRQEAKKIYTRTVLRIRDGQCFYGSTETIDDLALLLKKYILNPNKREDMSESPNKAIIWISFHEKGVLALKSFLEKIIIASEKAGVSQYLLIELRKEKHVNPPPPPAKLSEKNNT